MCTGWYSIEEEERGKRERTQFKKGFRAASIGLDALPSTPHFFGAAFTVIPALFSALRLLFFLSFCAGSGGNLFLRLLLNEVPS